MTEITHTAVEHSFVEDGRRGCGPGCELVVSECRCGLARRERVVDGTLRVLEFRLPGCWEWFSPMDVLRVELPVLLCPRCTGRGCDTCRGLGVLERIAPRPHTASGKR